jgi:hypothetical protein
VRSILSRIDSSSPACATEIQAGIPTDEAKPGVVPSGARERVQGESPRGSARHDSERSRNETRDASRPRHRAASPLEAHAMNRFLRHTSEDHGRRSKLSNLIILGRHFAVIWRGRSWELVAVVALLIIALAVWLKLTTRTA